MEGTCMELALEGERLCKTGDCRGGVTFFEAAVQVGTDDLKTLSAIYSQLGNAYFYLQEYGKALEYHKHDLNLARTLGDKLGEAKASGNLGNTLKVLGKFDEAIVCCQRHLDISRDMHDRIGEARALYNLGNVFHARGKHAGRAAHQDPGEFPADVRHSLQQAAKFYESNLVIVRELGDRAAQGRACGNLGNTHYLLGNFTEAVAYHDERLAIAKEFGDKSAERRAYSNLGNAHIFLGEFDVAAEQYKRTLQLAKQLGDRALEAQACYSLGNTYTLLRDYATAIEYHMQHWQIAQELNDRVGEGRACWSLGNAHTSLGNHDRAIQFAAKHLEISREIGDETGQLTAQMNLQDLQQLLGIQGLPEADASLTDNDSMTSQRSQEASRPRRRSMDNMDLVRMTPDKKENAPPPGGAKPKQHRPVAKASSVATEDPSRHVDGASRNQPATAADQSQEDEDFFDLLNRFQSRRIDDQRCSFRVLDNHKQTNSAQNTKPKIGNSIVQAEQFFDLVAGIQNSRMNDQRVEVASFPGLTNEKVLDSHRSNNKDVGSDLNDDFFEMLMRCQGSRMDEQRTSMPTPARAPTVPDEDFFSLIQRVQSNRLDGQRIVMPGNESKVNDKGNAADNRKIHKKKPPKN